MLSGTMDFEGKGTFIAKLSNGNTCEVCCDVIARNVPYGYYWESHYATGEMQQVGEDKLDEFALHYLEIPYPNEFTYKATGEMDEDESIEIVSIEDVIDWEMAEIAGSFDDGRYDEPDLDDWRFNDD